MAQEQIPRQEHASMNPNSSPYVAESGQVGELGQPTSGTNSAPNSAAESRMEAPPRSDQNYSQDYSHPQAPPDRGLHFGGKNSGAAGDTEVVRPHDQQHPLQATHDVNIGHGHEPFSSSATSAEPGYGAAAAPPAGHSPKRGVGSKVKDVFKTCTGHHYKEKPLSPKAGTASQVNSQPGLGEQQPGAHRSPGFVDKMKDAVTGQKPGQGAATGNATAGSAVPGEEDYTGGKAMNQQEGGWPRPVPPPGMSKQNLSAAEQYSPNQHSPMEPGHTPNQPHQYSPNEAGHTPNQPHQFSPNEPRHSPDQPHQYSPNEPIHTPSQPHQYSPNEPGHTPDQPHQYSPNEPIHTPNQPHQYPSNEPRYSPDQPHQGETGLFPPKADSAPRYDSANTYESRPGESHTEGPVASEGHAPSSLGGLMSSTPEEPKAKHETPTYENTGSQYSDPQGGIHQEGPRDDNVKKEGFMSKMMDKLHLGTQEKHKKNMDIATNI